MPCGSPRQLLGPGKPLCGPAAAASATSATAGQQGFCSAAGRVSLLYILPRSYGISFLFFIIFFFPETCLLAALELLTSPAFPVLPDKTVDFWGGRSCFKRQANAYRETAKPSRYAPHQFAVGQKPRVCVYICIYIYIYLKTAVVKFWLTVKRQHTNILKKKKAEGFQNPLARGCD